MIHEIAKGGTTVITAGAQKNSIRPLVLHCDLNGSDVAAESFISWGYLEKKSRFVKVAKRPSVPFQSHVFSSGENVAILGRYPYSL